MTRPHCAHFANTTLPPLEKNISRPARCAMCCASSRSTKRRSKPPCCWNASATRTTRNIRFARVLPGRAGIPGVRRHYMEGWETIAMVGGLSREQLAGCTDREMRVLKQRKTRREELKLLHAVYLHRRRSLCWDRTVSRPCRSSSTPNWRRRNRRNT